MCKHAWTYRAGHSECILCGAVAHDGRGLPYGHYAVNGEPITPARLRAGYACPICYADIRPRVIMGTLRLLCNGPDAHDIEQIGQAMPKAKRDYIIARQEMDAVDALYGLKGVLDMPIKDLQENARARLKRAGIIRLGEKRKSKNGKEYPAELPYFRLDDAPGLAQIYGAQPTRLNIYFPFDEIDRNLVAWHQVWVSGGLLCRGDGERIEYAVANNTGEVFVRDGRACATGTYEGVKVTQGHPVKCPGMAHDLYPRCAQCKPNALLIFLIRELPRLSYYQISTTSIHNIVKLTGQMRWVKENIGKLQGVPFILERRAEIISTPSGSNGKRARREKYLLNLEPDPEWVKAMLAEMHRRALPGGRDLPALSAGAPAQSEEETTVMVDATAFELDDEPEFEPHDYDTDAEYEHVKPVHQPDHSNGNTRPLAPHRLRHLLEKKSQQKSANGTSGDATSKQTKYLKWKLKECFAGDEDASKKRDAVIVWLFGGAELSMAQASAALDWVLGEDDGSGDRQVHPSAPEEARRVYTQALRDAGQQDMFGDDGE